MILECSAEQKQMAPNNLLGNNLYQRKLSAHCVTFVTCPSPVSLSNAFWNFRGEDASSCVSCAETLG